MLCNSPQRSFLQIMILLRLISFALTTGCATPLRGKAFAFFLDAAQPQDGGLMSYGANGPDFAGKNTQFTNPQRTAAMTARATKMIVV